MPIRKPASRPYQSTPHASEDEIEHFIEGGSPPATDQDKPLPKLDVKFQMVVPGDLCEIIDKTRKPSRTSRRAWMLQAAEEKLKREGLIQHQYSTKLEP